MISQVFLFYVIKSISLNLQADYILIHEYKMAEASAHYKQVKNFMGTKCAVLRIKYGKL